MLHKIRHLKPSLPRNICTEETQKGLKKCLLKGNIRPRESVAETAHIIGKVSGKETEEK